MKLLTSLRIYRDEARKLRPGGPPTGSDWKLLKFFPDWRRSLRPGANPLADRQPWLTFPTIAFLKQTLTSEMRVFEYGSGGSTLFFCQRAGEVVSVEHDAAWAEKVQNALAQNGVGNDKLQLIEPEPEEGSARRDPADPEGFVSSAECYRGKSFRKYAAAISTWPDGYFDFVVVDGRARPACIHQAAPKVKSGGWLLLDNAERGHYHRALTEFKEPHWLKRDFSGPGPHALSFWSTWGWQKVAKQSDRRL